MREFYTQVEEGRLVKLEVELDAQEKIEEKMLYPWLYTVFIKLKNPLPNGLGDEDEEDFLYECKERLTIKLEEKEKAVYVGSKTTDGWYELYFYLQDPKGMENKTKDILSAFGYKYESNSVKDKKWNLYEVTLIPNIKQMHHIQSRHIIEEMLEEGDDLTQQREVEHYVLFQTASLRQKFEEVLEEKSLTCKGDFERDEVEDFIYGIAIATTQDLQEESINGATDMILDLCREYHGHYEGWSASLADEKD
jgi:regulator of RNase E activity RraB